jgi:primosomal protein N' (replication factor Y) (superfamily II helicase)
MFAQVRVLSGLDKPLTYKISPDHDPNILVGKFVRVPLRNRTVVGIVEAILEQPDGNFTVKPIIGVEPFPDDPHYRQFLTKLVHYYQINAYTLLARLKKFMASKQTPIFVEAELQQSDVQHIMLTVEQQTVCDFLKPKIQTPEFTPTLLHGVTGSGKTEIYKQLLCHTLAQEKSVLFLLPEVSLAMQFFSLLNQQLGNQIPLFSFHSATKPSQKKILWQQLVSGNPVVIIGVHQPVLLPIKNLGCIIIDEEHDPGYQEKKHPKLNSKEVALLRAQQYNIPIVLGSATPSISSLYNVEKRGWHFFQLRHRFGGIFPAIEIISLGKREKQRSNFWITKELEDALCHCLKRKQQAILFINRRGFSFFVQCKKCSTIITCQHCSVSLTLHEHTILSCHYCGFSMPKPTQCLSCHAPEKELLHKGLGTQQVVSIVRKLFPTARVARADLDVSINKKLWQQTMQHFKEGHIDILVGTQTITKGYHIPNVTLVGVLWADLAINFPIYNAAETALQQLIQVAGRAGRGGLESRVIVQTMVEHPIFSYITELDYVKFYQHELENRLLVRYPPAVRLAEIELKNSNETTIEQEAQEIAQQLLAEISLKKLPVTLLGPAKPPVHKIKNEHSRKLYLKGPSVYSLSELFSFVEKNKFYSRIFFTPNPLQ